MPTIPAPIALACLCFVLGQAPAQQILPAPETDPAETDHRSQRRALKQQLNELISRSSVRTREYDAYQVPEGVFDRWFESLDDESRVALLGDGDPNQPIFDTTWWPTEFNEIGLHRPETLDERVRSPEHWRTKLQQLIDESQPDSAEATDLLPLLAELDKLFQETTQRTDALFEERFPEAGWNVKWTATILVQHDRDHWMLDESDLAELEESEYRDEVYAAIYEQRSALEHAAMPLVRSIAAAEGPHRFAHEAPLATDTYYGAPGSDTTEWLGSQAAAAFREGRYDEGLDLLLVTRLVASASASWPEESISSYAHDLAAESLKNVLPQLVGARLSEAQLKRLRDAVDAFKPMPPEYGRTASRLSLRAMIDAQMSSLRDSVPARSAARDAIQTLSREGGFMSSRGTHFALLNTIDTVIDSWRAEEPEADVRKERLDRIFDKDLPHFAVRAPLVRMAYTGQSSRTVFSEQKSDTLRNGLLTMIAIERFRREHGRLPSTMDELPPETDEHTIDVVGSSEDFPERLIYFVTDETPEDYEGLGSGYVLHSRGIDKIDHGGYCEDDQPGIALEWTCDPESRDFPFTWTKPIDPAAPAPQ